MPSANVLTSPEHVKPYSPWKCCSLMKNKEVIRHWKWKCYTGASEHDFLKNNFPIFPWFLPPFFQYPFVDSGIFVLAITWQNTSDVWIVVCFFVDDDGNDGLFYTSQDLEYIYFVHSLCLLGRVLLYSGGRALFPVLLPEREGDVRFTCRRTTL